MRSKILALAAVLAISTAIITTSAMAFRGGHGMGMGGGHVMGMRGGAHWGGHHFARFDRDDFRFHRHIFLAAGPGFVGGPCWHPVWTPWGRRWRRVC